MSLTHIDCYIYRGQEASLDNSSFVAVNPRHAPGSLVVASAQATRESISSQVACKLALEHFLTGVLDFYNGSSDKFGNPIQNKSNGELNAEMLAPKPEISLEVLEAAFKNANSSVYSFGHKLAAGGRMSASLLGMVLDEDLLAVGKVGPGSVYLFRQGELFPFFENSKEKQSDISHESLIGAHSLVSVELASVPAEESDAIIMLSKQLDTHQEEKLAEVLLFAGTTHANISTIISKKVFGDIEKLPLTFVANLGPETIYLAEAV
jgi:hypothetical protein